MIRVGLTFDDVLLVPKHSSILPPQVSLETRFTRNIKLSVPLSSSAMDTVTETAMAKAMNDLGGIGVVHKNSSIEVQSSQIQAVKLMNPQSKVAAAIGVGPDWRTRLNALIRAGTDAVVLDSAHGHSDGVVVLARTIKKDLPHIELIAGNVATYDGAKALCDAGVDAIKTGIGPGSICTTRIVSGVGVPQLTAIEECVRAADLYDIPVIADGGIKYSGDIVKALAIGAESVMIGSLFAGTDESPGEKIEIDGKWFKGYRGMGSISAMEKGSKDRYFQEGSKKLVPEGVEALVPFKGSVKEVVFQLLGGLRSGMGYTGAKNIQELRSKAEFIQITPAGLKESHVHDLASYKHNDNY